MYVCLFVDGLSPLLVASVVSFGMASQTVLSRATSERLLVTMRVCRVLCRRPTDALATRAAWQRELSPVIVFSGHDHVGCVYAHKCGGVVASPAARSSHSESASL